VIELERHIEILLLSNDCVIVPGLGGFVAHHANARFDEDDGMFLPPLRTIGFNQQLKMNDSLLAQSYAEAYDISYPTALQRIESDVKTLQKQLEEEGSYELNDIGTLMKNSEGNIEFTPCEAGILTPEFYGLSSFDLPIRSKDYAVQKETASKTARKGIVYIDSSAGTGHKTINIRLNALRNVAVTAAIIVFSFIIASPMDHSNRGIQAEKAESGILRDMLMNSNKEQSGNVLPSSKKDIKSVAKARKTVSVKQKNTEKQAKPKKKAQETPAAAMSNAPYWCIVLCSHVQLDNAKAFGSQLSKEGLENKIIEGRNGTAKVVYGNYSTEAEAYSALNSMQGNTRFKQGWITKIEKAKQ